MESKQHKGATLTLLLLILAYTAAASVDFTDPPSNESSLKSKAPEFYKFLGECIRKTTTYCGSQVVNYIFKNVEFDHAVCCPRILGAGYRCNRVLTENLADFDKFKKSQHKANIIARGDSVYDQCVKYVGGGGVN